jgi:hypothetical protein
MSTFSFFGKKKPDGIQTSTTKPVAPQNTGFGGIMNSMSQKAKSQMQQAAQIH